MRMESAGPVAVTVAIRTHKDEADMLSMSTYSLLGTERECIQKCLSACYDLVAGDPKP